MEGVLILKFNYDVKIKNVTEIGEYFVFVVKEEGN